MVIKEKLMQETMLIKNRTIGLVRFIFKNFGVK